jgi:hypothetical protein
MFEEQETDLQQWRRQQTLHFGARTGNFELNISLLPYHSNGSKIER